VKLTVLAAGILAAGVLVSATLISLTASANPGASIRILFDLGDGTYVWASGVVPDPSATNATWLAVQDAARASGVAIESAWYACCGVAISDLGGRHSPAGFIGLYAWNATTHAWAFTGSGISGLVVQDGDAIALYNAGFDSASFAGRLPVPTPDDPRPTLEFRGDLSNSGTSGSAAPADGRLLWDHDTGSREIGSTPAIAWGKVFVNTLEGFTVLDARTGTSIWTNPHVQGFSSPAVFDGSVIVGTRNGTVVRMNATSGTVMWEQPLLSETQFSGITSSPKVAYDSVFIGVFNESGGPGEVASLWASNGTIAWRHPTGSIDFSSPAYADGTVYVGVMGFYNRTTQVTFDPPYGVLALDGRTGAQRWFFETDDSVAASPVVAGAMLIIPSKDGNVYAVNRSSGIEVWRASAAAGISSPAFDGDTVYVGGGAFGGAGHVRALDVATGSTRWTFSPNGPVQASVTYAGGTVLFATNTAQGIVYALNATNGAMRWSFSPSPAEYILGSPVVADGVVFAPSDNGHVYALAETQTVPHLQLPVLELGVVVVVVGIVAVAAWFVVRRSRRVP